MNIINHKEYIHRSVFFNHMHIVSFNLSDILYSLSVCISEAYSTLLKKICKHAKPLLTHLQQHNVIPSTLNFQSLQSDVIKHISKEFDKSNYGR